MPTGQYWVVKIDHGGAYHLAKNMRKFRFEVKWEGNFPENLFGNCGQPPEVVHFFRSERNLGNAPYHLPYRVKCAGWNAG